MKKEEWKRLREENAQKREYEKEKQRMKDKLCKEPGKLDCWNFKY